MLCRLESAPRLAVLLLTPQALGDISYHITPYHIISYHNIINHISYIISYHIISYHIISYHMQAVSPSAKLRVALPLRIQFNLSDFTRRAYGTNYIETLRVQLHANCRRLALILAAVLVKRHPPHLLQRPAL